MNAVETRHLTKKFENGVVAVSDLTMTMPKGSVYGLLGPNGAGKTTTVRLLNGMLTPTSGESVILGIASDDQALRQRTATLAENAQMYEHLTAWGNLAFFARLYDLPAAGAEERIESLLKRMGLWERRNDKLGTFSTGMRKRVFLARTLIHDPELLFLDEPTSGLDPESARDVTDLIRELAVERGTTVLLCTHNLPLAERICDHYGFLKHGRLVADGTAEDLIASIRRRPEVRIISADGERGEVTEIIGYDDEAEIPGIVRKKLDAGAEIREVRRVRPSLDEVYFSYIGEGNS
ncbi:MAG: ABC transporter ATP-binding protein [Spirochaetota bacterium]